MYICTYVHTVCLSQCTYMRTYVCMYIGAPSKCIMFMYRVIRITMYIGLVFCIISTSEQIFGRASTYAHMYVLVYVSLGSLDACMYVDIQWFY